MAKNHWILNTYSNFNSKVGFTLAGPPCKLIAQWILLMTRCISGVFRILWPPLLNTPVLCSFYARQCSYSAYMPWQFRPSVRLSVCLSVRPSHGWISQKRLKLGSRNFHHIVGCHMSLKGGPVEIWCPNWVGIHIPSVSCGEHENGGCLIFRPI